ncbi:ATP-binding cassette domain-containing protein [Kribbella sp. NPDC054772]
MIRAVDGVTFDIDAGKTVTIIGESSSGKSTTAMALLRLLADDLAVVAGQAELAGKDVIGTRKHISALRGRAVVLVPQDPMTALNPIATVGRQMIEAIRLRHHCGKADARDRALALLRQVHLSRPEQRLKRRR